jgi:hypothetical protein
VAIDFCTSIKKYKLFLYEIEILKIQEGRSVVRCHEPSTPKPEAGYVKEWYHTEERIIMKTIKYAVKLASSYSDVIALK